MSYHALNIIFQFPKLDKSITIKKIKNYLNDISILFGRLVYTLNYKDEIIYNDSVLRRLKIKLTEQERKDFLEKKIKADLLIVVQFVKLKKRIAINEIYTRNDEDDSADSRRTYISLLKIKRDFNFKESNSETIFKLGVIREIFKILGFRKEFLKNYFVRNNFAEIPPYLINHMKSFKAYKKYLNFTDREYIPNKYNSKTKFYNSFWDDEYNIADIIKINY